MKINKIDIFLASILLLLIAFTIAMIVIFTRQYSVPDSLIVAVFGAAGGECGILGWIKSSKEKARQREWDKEDRAEAKSEAAAAKAAAGNNNQEDDTKCVG